MSIEITTKGMGAEKIFYDGYSEQEISSDISLPDYCPDIMRILKCTVTPNITTSKITGDRATADGVAKINVIYSDEKNSIFCYSTEYPFSKFAELASAYDSATLSATAKVEFVNCRAISKRRLDIHGALNIHFKVSGTSCDRVISSAVGDGIQLKRKSIDISSVKAVTGKRFQLSQAEEVGSTMPGIGKIIDCCASPIVNETKVIKGKLLIKGELTVRVVYSADSGENETAVLGSSIPFNEIIEDESFNDSCKPVIKLNVSAINAEPKVDNDGEYRVMNISADIFAYITAYEDDCINVVTDAYSTQTEINTKYTLMDFSKINADFSDSFVCRQNLDVSSINPQKLYATIVSEPEFKHSFSDGKLKINGKIGLSLILIDGEGVPICCEREAEFEYSRSVDGDSEKLSCAPQINLMGCACTLAGNGNADFKAELSVKATVFDGNRDKVLTSLTVEENCAAKSKKSSLTVYFCSGNESLWDIARRYNTTVEDIMEENELSADYLENKTILMIPVK